MRTILALAALATLGAGAAEAQPYAPPPGSYQRQCTNIYMEGQFLHATCHGAVSSINVMSCAAGGDIGVGPDGGLVCAGPNARGPVGPQYSPAAPGYGAPAYRDPGYDGRGAYRRGGLTLFSGRNLRGQAMQVRGETPNLADLGLNDRVRSIRLEPGSGPWQVCTDAGYRGRCTTVTASVSDTRRIGMDEGISSLRPLRDERYDPRYERRY